jgi:long-chain acyl-CoA synthetase
MAKFDLSQYSAKLDHLNERFQTGKSGLEKDEIKSLAEQLNEQLMLTVSGNVFDLMPEIVHNLNDVIETILVNQLTADVLEGLSEQSVFEIGKYLTEHFNTADPAQRKLIHNYLDLIRFREFLTRMTQTPKWEQLIRRLIDQSNFNVHYLVQQRIRDYPKKTAFRLLIGENEEIYTWNRINDIVDQYALGVFSLVQYITSDTKVAFLMENSLNMVLLDLACLTSGIVNIMIPANSVPEHIEFILNQTKSPVIFLSNDKQLAKIKSIKKNLPYLKQAVLLTGTSIESWVISLKDMIKDGQDIARDQLDQRKAKIKINELATIMYTSGTTGDPKGIMFSHMNLVYKRFCRAIALPEIGEGDRFLAYLPLFHTFGRWLEMMGSIFWGAEYNFMENPALVTMLDNMQRVKPTIFISIPKKWYELYDHIRSEVNIEIAETEKILEVTKRKTGGSLKWGLSAAGYLEPEVFKFFQFNGIELMSGFGMTEATGGITMTPPGKYRENSLGKPLPGIELKLAEDGELMIRGPYVMMDYFGMDKEHSAFVDGWFPTGDVMEKDSAGFYEIIDRKKEIYKNIKGETIAPQKIENLFRDFDSVFQVFLVGDHRPYNTVLIYPNQEAEHTKLDQMNPEEKESYFASVVVTVNKFLAPFERIVDFRIIDRPFLAEKGELTPKGTYKRKVIENSFSAIIDSMYRKNFISLSRGEMDIHIPTWFLRERGCLANDIRLDGDSLLIEKYGDRLVLMAADGNNRYQIGNQIYKVEANYIDMQHILANPILWIGNKELLDFTGESIFQWYRLDDKDDKISFEEVKSHYLIPPDITKNFLEMIEQPEYSLFGLNLAVLHLQSPDEDQAMTGIKYLKLVIDEENLPFYKILNEIVPRFNLTENINIQRELFRTGLKIFKEHRFLGYLDHFVRNVPGFLDSQLSSDIVRGAKSDEYLFAIHNTIKNEVEHYKVKGNLQKTALPALLFLLAEFGIQHPTKYKRCRQLIVRYELYGDLPDLSAVAGDARQGLEQGFRKWLGDNREIAVDAETGIEYYWEDVLTFEDSIDSKDQKYILEIIKSTAMLREAIFLFSEGRIIRLYDIPPSGVWISIVDDMDDKIIYRISIQTRHYGSYDVALHRIKSAINPEIVSEINWMIHASAPRRKLKLVEDFGGYWENYRVWTQEYIAGETVGKFIKRTLRREKADAESRLFHLWPFFIWTAMVAQLNFWKRSGYEIELKDKSVDNIVIPRHDYQTGQRFISIAERQKSPGLYSMMRDFYDQFIIETQKEYTFLSRDFICRFIFYAVLDSEGEIKGLELLKDALVQIQKHQDQCEDDDLTRLLNEFIKEIEEKGYIPKNLFFAIRRFHRWYDLNKNAELSAQARTMNELFDTYQLPDLLDIFPETRTRFFLETVFAESLNEIKQALLRIVLKQHENSISHDESLSLFSMIQNEFELTEKEQFFLSRLSYPHLKPTDFAELVSTQSEGTQQADVVVRLEDYDGLPYWVRKPVSPKEISKLHQLFLDSNLPVYFRPEDRFMVAVSERGHVIGGLFYSYIEEKMVYMEKIVVSGHFRRKGISEGLMHEFFNRMRGERMQRVTTGFFRPEYFYRFGFKIERKYAGLVKDLDTESSEIINRDK